MEGCTLGGVFIVLEQEMQEFGRLGMLSNFFLWSGHAQRRLCGSHDPMHLLFGAIWRELLEKLYTLLFHLITGLLTLFYHPLQLRPNVKQANKMSGITLTRLWIKVLLGRMRSLMLSCFKNQINRLHVIWQAL